jgi:hypothetical protein
MASRTAAALALGAALLARPASAQALAKLTVESFTQSSDTTRPQSDVPFRLIVTLRVRERINRIANLELPILADLELLGDERETVSGPRGSQYRETVTVVAHHSGTIAIAPATLQAIDARDGRAKQWYSNGLTLIVSGGASAPPVRLRTLALWFAGLCLALVLAWLFRRRPTLPLPAPQPAPTVAPAQLAVAPRARSRRDQLQDALTVLCAEQSRAAAVRVRAAVWRMLGAGDGETLGDLLRHVSPNGTMRELLIALERSAFTYDDDLSAAIDDACSALEREIGSPA